ncbi:hypothetical protein E2C01_067885 [Portunus trituberculatus]|uniref:Uncharacterized protein n=1 Tax=Portunus trituberculatus TaxID=210409 RepID=A0A5B7HQI3_PORTR|nr:hypothetical protein [Portunus trituberculatus]
MCFFALPMEYYVSRDGVPLWSLRFDVEQAGKNE